MTHLQRHVTCDSTDTFLILSDARISRHAKEQNVKLYTSITMDVGEAVVEDYLRTMVASRYGLDSSLLFSGANLCFYSAGIDVHSVIVQPTKGYSKYLRCITPKTYLDGAIPHVKDIVSEIRMTYALLTGRNCRVMDMVDENTECDEFIMISVALGMDNPVSRMNEIIDYDDHGIYLKDNSNAH